MRAILSNSDDTANAMTFDPTLHILQLLTYRNFPLLGAYALISTGRKWAPKFEICLTTSKWFIGVTTITYRLYVLNKRDFLTTVKTALNSE